jgi:hypothetical protein
MFIVWAVYTSLPHTLPNPLIPLPVAYNERETHGFVPTTVPRLHYRNCQLRNCVISKVTLLLREVFL